MADHSPGSIPSATFLIYSLKSSRGFLLLFFDSSATVTFIPTLSPFPFSGDCMIGDCSRGDCVNGDWPADTVRLGRMSALSPVSPELFGESRIGPLGRCGLSPLWR